LSAVLWLRRDLRVHDNPALWAAAAGGDPLAVVFVLDERLLAGRFASGPRSQFLLQCLSDIDESLRARGSRLTVLCGAPERELVALVRSLGASHVHLAADASPFARARDRRVLAALRPLGARAVLHPGTFVIDDLSVPRTGAGAPHTVFSPFYRAWAALPRRPLLPAPARLAAPPSATPVTSIPSLAELGLRQECQAPAPGGELAAREAMSAWLEGPVDGYAQDRDRLSGEHVSRLSPYLHLGAISARELEARLPAGAGGEAYRRQLCWRDFYAHVLRHFPANASQEHQQRVRGRLAWRNDERDFGAWCEGRTGYPVVDAAMRQLRREGWMHNRARLIVGSFLTKDLGIDWRWGERHFMRLLLDGDHASNNGNWQWIASVGVDPQPAFKRIFNPALQQRRHDPDGEYVRRYLPELAGVPERFLAEPWRMPADCQLAANCVIGRDYPPPIVDHAQARREALQRFRAAGEGYDRGDAAV
jgi:deoxyribodipyrimidine photo-lyase